jgi:hypothetical protein
MRGMTKLHREANPRCTQRDQRGGPPTKDARRPKSGSLTHAGRWMVTPVTSSTPGAPAGRTHEQRGATTLDGVDATTAAKTAPRRRSPQAPVCSAGRSARQHSPNTSANPRPSSNTTGRRTPACGSTTTVWLVSWAGPPATRSSSATCPCILATRPGRGSSTCPLARSTTGTIWSARSWATSRAPWKFVGPALLHTESRRVAAGLHTALLQALH